MIHMMASDYDGTLFKDRIIRESDLEAIREFRSLGHKFGIVTGRTIDSIKHEIETYDIPVDFLVGINGGVVLDHESNELFLSSMDEDVADKIIELIEDFGVDFYGTNDGYRISRTYSPAGKEFHMKPNIKLHSIEEIKETGIVSMYIWSGSKEKSKELSDLINDSFKSNGIYSFPNVHAVDVGVQDINKATGIEILRNHYGYKGHVYTVGDSHNDVPMIEEFHGFLMDSGELELEPLAKGGLVSTVGDAINKVIKSL